MKKTGIKRVARMAASLSSCVLVVVACAKSDDKAPDTISDKKVTVAPPKTTSPPVPELPPLPPLDPAKDGASTPISTGPVVPSGPAVGPEVRPTVPLGPGSGKVVETSPRPISYPKYSGASSDYLRSFLETKQNEIKSLQQRQQNLNLASEVQKAFLKIDYNASSAVVLTLVLGSFERDEKKIVLSGAFDEKFEAVLTGKLENSPVTGTLKCMDKLSADGPTCENAVASIAVDNKSIEIIFRRTEVELKAIFPSHQCLTAGCEKVFNLFSQTELHKLEGDSLKKAKLESYEVIQGRSGFRLILLSRDNQVITASGPLLNPLLCPVTNILADRTFLTDDLVDLRDLKNYHFELQNILSDIRITENSGNGNIVLQMLMKRSDGVMSDQFQLNIHRVQREVIPMVETAEVFGQKISDK